MIAALAVEPFPQQIVHYEDCLQPIPQLVASISRTNSYSTYGFEVGLDGATSLDATMVDSLYTGLINPPANSTSLIVTECPTGNCTFPSDNGASYSSIAMCHSCEDISDQIKGNGCPTGSDNGTWYLPSGAFINVYNPSSTSRPIQDGSGFTEFDNLMMRWEGCINTATDEIATVQSCTQSRTQSPQAVRCSIFPCLKTYGANITYFHLTEVVFESTRLLLIAGNYPGPPPHILAQNSTFRDGVWQDCKPATKNSSTNPYPEQYCTPTPVYCNAVGSDFYYPVDRFWVLGGHSGAPLAEHLDGLLI